MVIQKVTINANSEEELEGRIEDLKKRGYELVGNPVKRESEHTVFSYGSKGNGFNRHRRETDVLQRLSAQMVRDYQG